MESYSYILLYAYCTLIDAFQIDVGVEASSSLYVRVRLSAHTGFTSQERHFEKKLSLRQIPKVKKISIV